MCQERILDQLTSLAQPFDGQFQVDGVPENDGSDYQVIAVLTFTAVLVVGGLIYLAFKASQSSPQRAPVTVATPSPSISTTPTKKELARRVQDLNSLRAEEENARSRLALAEADAQRAEELFQAKVISKDEQDATTKRDQAKASLLKAQAKARMRRNRPWVDQRNHRCRLTLITIALFPAIVRFLCPGAVLIQGTSQLLKHPSKTNPAKPANDWLMSL